MRIKDLSLYVVELPFRFTFKHSLADRCASINLIVKATVETDDGHIFVGYGEGIPRDYVTGETIEQASQRLTKIYFHRFMGRHFSDVQQLVQVLQEEFKNFELERNPAGASWCSLETALLDAACKASGISLLELLSNKPAEKDSIKYGAVAPFAKKKALIGLLLFSKLYGFSTIKIKVGNDLKTDLENIKLARQIMGQKAILRVDANCAWSVAQTIEFAQKAEVYNIASIEQPVEADNFSGLVQLASSIPQPIVLDESLCTINQAKEFINKGVKVEFNIRLSKVGGMLAAKAIRDLARSAGINCHLGAQVGESGILTAAGRIFAAAEGPFSNYEGAANSFLLQKDLTKENLTYGYGGIGKLPPFSKRSINGLGITVDEKQLFEPAKQLETIFG